MSAASSIRLVAREELRVWRRSSLAVVAAMVAALLAVVSVVSTVNRVAAEAEARTALQETSEATFLSQPDRHPHRMVHYGHFVFRAPPPLAALDPGVDPYTGTALFLEGHRQNSATFSQARSAAWPGVLGGLTPAATYQIVVPLLLVLIGYASVAREREGGTGAQLAATGVSLRTLWLGKSLALGLVAALLLVPLVLGAMVTGEGAVAAVLFAGTYALYLAIWVFVITAASVLAATSSGALVALVTAWTCLTLAAPRLAALTAEAVLPVAGKVETDLAVAAAMRELGDGHNANDPAFARLRAELLEEYGVERVEDLPVNFRGIVAQASEAELTAMMNRFAEERMAAEAEQAALSDGFGLISPAAILGAASSRLAGTDLRAHHRFLREAEAVRYEFVQGLNEAHANDLSYEDDMNRNAGEAGWRRARIAADNWRVLSEFSFEPAPQAVRAGAVAPMFAALVAWLAGAVGLGWVGAGREIVRHD